MALTELRHGQYYKTDWDVLNNLIYHKADNTCSTSERLISACKRLCEDTKRQVDYKKEEITRKFDHRISDIDFWRNETDRQILNLEENVNKLLQFRDRLISALSACDPPLHAVQECLRFRLKRKGVDDINDLPQQQLIKDVHLIRDIQALLQQSLDKVNEQIRVNRSVRHYLLRDVADKYSAFEIDTVAGGKSSPTTSAPLHFQEALLTPDQKAVTLGDWLSFNMHNVRKSEYECQKSREMHPIIEEILTQIIQDMQMQHNAVIAALQDRVAQSHQAKARIEERLARIVEQIEEIDDTIVLLKQSLDDKVAPLSLAQTRLQIRRDRPRMELVRDDVETELEREVALLSTCIKELHLKLKEAEDMLRNLIMQRQKIEEEVDHRAATVYIDEVECLGQLAGTKIVKH